MIGDLVSIPDKETNAFLTTLTSKQAWIGISDADSEGTWTWSDGTLENYTNWYNEPNIPYKKYKDNEYDFVAFNYGDEGFWIDNSKEDVLDAFICQYKSGEKKTVSVSLTVRVQYFYFSDRYIYDNSTRKACEWW